MVISRRERIRDAAEEILRSAGAPLHNREITERLHGQTGFEGDVTPKDVNTTLHDDPLGRFQRVGRGIWRVQ